MFRNLVYQKEHVENRITSMKARQTHLISWMLRVNLNKGLFNAVTYSNKYFLE